MSLWKETFQMALFLLDKASLFNIHILRIRLELKETFPIWKIDVPIWKILCFPGATKSCPTVLRTPVTKSWTLPPLTNPISPPGSSPFTVTVKLPTISIPCPLMKLWKLRNNSRLRNRRGTNRNICPAAFPKADKPAKAGNTGRSPRPGTLITASKGPFSRSLLDSRPLVIPPSPPAETLWA